MKDLQALLLSILEFYNVKVTKRNGVYIVRLSDNEVDLIIIYGEDVEAFKEIIEVLDEYIRGQEQDNVKNKA